MKKITLLEITAQTDGKSYVVVVAIGADTHRFYMTVQDDFSVWNVNVDREYTLLFSRNFDIFSVIPKMVMNYHAGLIIELPAEVGELN